jgi:hypothetical protein
MPWSLAEFAGDVSPDGMQRPLNFLAILRSYDRWRHYLAGYAGVPPEAEVPVRSLVSRSPLWAAVAGAIAIVAAGCSSPGSTAKPAKPKPPISARQAIALSAHNVASWHSDSSTTTVTGTDGGARISFAWALREEPGPFNESAVTSYKRDGKDVLPGGSDAVVTPTVYYIRAAVMSRYYHTTKPWVAIPPATFLTVSAKIHNSTPGTPGTPGAFFGDPVLGVGLLTTSTDVRAVGPGSVNGVPVTEYEGAYSAASGLAYIKATLGSAFSAQVTAMGLTTVRFRAWLDAQQRPLKLVLIEAGTHANLTVTQTIVSINQPANIQFPLASETYVVPGAS